MRHPILIPLRFEATTGKKLLAFPARWRPRTRVLFPISLLVGYVLLAIWSTWPLALSPRTKLPTGALQVATVPLFNVWTIWWNSDRLLHGFRDYWRAPIFFPETDAFAYSEPQPVTVLVAPLIWLTGSRVLAYNFYLWISLVLNGWSAAQLLRRVGVGRLLAAFGGAAMLLLPIVHWQIDVIQLIPLWGILWTWTACWQFGSSPTIGRGVMLGLAFSTAVLLCGHQGLFLAVLLAGSVWPLVRTWRHKAVWLGGLLALVVVVLLIGPIVIQMRHSLAREEFRREPGLVQQLSAVPRDYIGHTGRELIRIPGLGERREWGFLPGWLKVTCASLGLLFGLCRRRWRRWSLFLLLMGALAFALSLGPNLQLGSWQPWWTLTQSVPGFSRVRNVFRFAFFVQMAVLLLGIQGLYALQLGNRWARSRWGLRRVYQSLVFLLAVVMAIEIRPLPLALAQAPDEKLNSGWIQYLREQTTTQTPILCLPVATGVNVEDFETTTQWMYYGSFHSRPLVNGYSGFFPRESTDLQDTIQNRFFRESTLRKLHEEHIEFIVIDTKIVSRVRLQNLRWGAFRLELQFADPSGVDVYRLIGPNSGQGAHQN